MRYMHVLACPKLELKPLVMLMMMVMTSTILTIIRVLMRTHAVAAIIAKTTSLARYVAAGEGMHTALESD